jgi:hypothetical protein
MTSDPSPRPVSPLRARMIEDMTVRGFSEHTRSELCATRPGIRGLHWPVARHGDGGGPAPLPTTPDADRHAAAEHQRRGLGPALLLHGDARPIRSASKAQSGAGSLPVQADSRVRKSYAPLRLSASARDKFRAHVTNLH